MRIIRAVVGGAAVVAAALQALPLFGQATGRIALTGATLIDGTGRPPLLDAVVLIENGRIRAVGPRAQTRIPPGVERVDFTGLTILPGLIDSHVHLRFALPRDTADTTCQSPLDAVLRDFLRHGITGIRDVGDAYPWIIELGRAIDEGQREGPRIFAAGPILTAPGGHPAGTLLRGNPAAIAAATRQISSPEEGRAVVRDLARGGVDLIKVVVDSGGRATTAHPDRLPTLNPATLRAVVAASSAAHLPVTVHWGNVDELAAIVETRPQQLEH